MKEDFDINSFVQKEGTGLFIPQEFRRGKDSLLALGEEVANLFDNVEVCEVPISGCERDHTMQVCHIPPQNEGRNLLLSIDGVHGIEGQYGNLNHQVLMKRVLAEDFNDFLQTYGILLISSVNPWGVDKGRRVTKEGVDLNRSGYVEEEFPEENHNPNFERVYRTLTPQGKVSASAVSDIMLRLRLATDIVKFWGLNPKTWTMRGAKDAILKGQHSHADSLFYGGKAPQPNFLTMWREIEKRAPQYTKVIAMDNHTGYPGGEALQKVEASATVRKQVGALLPDETLIDPRQDGDDFYEFGGDSLSYLLKRMKQSFPATQFVPFYTEMTTDGLSKIDAMVAMIMENQMHKNLRDGIKISSDTEGKIVNQFRRMFASPREEFTIEYIRLMQKTYDEVVRNCSRI